jgi:hypothetical protein
VLSLGASISSAAVVHAVLKTSRLVAMHTCQDCRAVCANNSSSTYLYMYSLDSSSQTSAADGIAWCVYCVCAAVHRSLCVTRSMSRRCSGVAGHALSWAELRRLCRTLSKQLSCKWGQYTGGSTGGVGGQYTGGSTGGVGGQYTWGSTGGVGGQYTWGSMQGSTQGICETEAHQGS